MKSHQQIHRLAIALPMLLLLLVYSNHDVSNGFVVTAFITQQQPQQQKQRTNEIKSRGFRSSSCTSSSSSSPLPTTINGGCKWGLTVLHAAKSKSGTFLCYLENLLTLFNLTFQL